MDTLDFPKVLMTGTDGQPRMVPDELVTDCLRLKGFTMGYTAPTEPKKRNRALKHEQPKHTN